MFVQNTVPCELKLDVPVCWFLRFRRPLETRFRVLPLFRPTVGRQYVYGVVSTGGRESSANAHDAAGVSDRSHIRHSDFERPFSP